MSGLTIRELIGELKRQEALLGGDAPVVIQCRLSGFGSKGVVEYRHLSHLVPLNPDQRGKQGLNIVGDQYEVYRRFVDHHEVIT